MGFHNYFITNKYCKVASSRLSWLVAHLSRPAYFTANGGIVKLHNFKYINRGCPVVSGLCILFSPPAGHVKSNGRSEENSFTPIFGHNVPASLAAPSGRAAQHCPSLPVLLDAQLLIPFLFLKGALFRRLLCLKASSFKSSKWCDSLDIPTLSVSEPPQKVFL